MCQACLILASRRSGDAAPAESALGSRPPARFRAVAEWADAADEVPATEAGDETVEGKNAD